jgi:hypothetical protein
MKQSNKLSSISLILSKSYGQLEEAILMQKQLKKQKKQKQLRKQKKQKQLRKQKRLLKEMLLKKRLLKTIWTLLPQNSRSRQA